MMRVSQGNSERKAGGVILLFLFVLSLATFHSGCAGLTKASSSGAPPSAPTVSITSPTSSATVSASTTVSANASANTVGAQFKLDGANLGAERTSTPFSISWDTTTVADGQHTLTAVARNATGQTAPSAPVTVTVQNSAGGNPPVISGVGASPGSTSVLIFWTTDALSDSQVDYGTTVSYGQTSALDSTAVTAHSVAIGGLAASTPYHYRVKSKDAAGHLATSADFTFSTLPPGAQDSLAALAASMAPGTWAELKTVGLPGTLVPPLGVGSVLEYNDRLAWDPIKKRVYVLGGAHNSGCAPDYSLCDRFGYYDAATNTWVNLPQPCAHAVDASNCDFPLPQFRASHGYEHLTADSAGNLYYRLYFSSQVMKWTPSTQTWSTLPNIPAAIQSYIQVAGALVYFPERNSLVFVNGGCCDNGATGEIYEFNLGTQTWANGPSHVPMGNFSNFVTYSPVLKVVIFGGGGPVPNNKIYKYDTSGVITSLVSPTDPALATLGVGDAVTGTVSTVDSVTGNFIFWNILGHEWDFNPTSNVWTRISITPPAALLPNPGFGGVANIAAVPIPDYGVVMVVTYNFSSSAVYLYKHAAP